MKVYYSKLHNIVHTIYLALNVFTASKELNLNILFAITAATVVLFGGPKKSPRTSPIVQIIFLRVLWDQERYSSECLKH